MRLYRSHGLGNDYLVLESGTLTPARVRALCDRHEGVGSDGVLEPVPGRDGADLGVRIHNPDGSEAEKSGNGLRIFADWAVGFRGAPAAFTVWTAGGVVRCRVGEGRVQVEMGRARRGAPWRFEGHEAWPVDVGNPHHVVFAAPGDWEAVGARLEHAVEGRTNVQFVTVEGGRVRARIWERGAGRTRSSGSSACAVAAVCVARGLVPSPVAVEMEGGVLTVTVGREEALLLDGPVERIGRIEVDPGWLARRGVAS